MKKIISSTLSIFICCMFLSSCSAKLTTIQPTLISKINIEKLSSGDKIELVRTGLDEVEWLMDDLVLQMEQLYVYTGKCTSNDDHLYKAEYYFKQRLELIVMINSDGSVCKNNKHYRLSKEQSDRISEYLDNWGMAFQGDD